VFSLPDRPLVEPQHFLAVIGVADVLKCEHQFHLPAGMHEPSAVRNGRLACAALKTPCRHWKKVRFNLAHSRR
jgi:hypothetical protein